MPNILHYSKRRIKAAAEPRIPLIIKNTQTVDGFAHQVETIAKYVKKGAIDNKEQELWQAARTNPLRKHPPHHHNLQTTKKEV